MNPLPLRLPPPVRPGDRVGVFAPSGPVAAERLEAGLDALRALGYEPVLAANARRRAGLFAGSDDERLAGLHELADDPSIRALLLTRGGHGVLRLLPRIDWRRLGRVERVWMGFSDATPLLLGLVERARLLTWHGPMVGADLARGQSTAERDAFVAALEGRLPVALDAPRALRGGVAEGTLLGGCLTLLVHLLGTPWAPDLTGAIVFWEEVDEPWYRLDRMLTHLRVSGTLSRISGMVIGDVAAVEEPAHGTDAWLASARELADDLAVPVAAGVAAGHRSPNLPLPLGLAARLDVAAGTLVAGLPPIPALAEEVSP